jgi:D-aminoacyl-tRNA deacylase
VRVLLQRVSEARVRVDGAVVGEIGPGLLALVGVGPADTPEIARALAAKCVDLRIFRDENGLTNRSLEEAGGDVLAVSQFTLYADTRKGRRPSFIRAAAPELGRQRYEDFVAALTERGVRVARGEFGSEMRVELVNDGPFTIWLDSDDR